MGRFPTSSPDNIQSEFHPSGEMEPYYRNQSMLPQPNIGTPMFFTILISDSTDLVTFGVRYSLISDSLGLVIMIHLGVPSLKLTVRTAPENRWVGRLVSFPFGAKGLFSGENCEFFQGVYHI